MLAAAYMAHQKQKATEVASNINSGIWLPFVNSYWNFWAADSPDVVEVLNGLRELKPLVWI
jgi:hypothetical protein